MIFHGGLFGDLLSCLLLYLLAAGYGASASYVTPLTQTLPASAPNVLKCTPGMQFRKSQYEYFMQNNYVDTGRKDKTGHPLYTTAFDETIDGTLTFKVHISFAVWPTHLWLTSVDWTKVNAQGGVLAQGKCKL